MSDTLRQALLGVRRARGLVAPPVLSATLVDAVQARLGEHLPDTVLAYYAGLERDLWDVEALTLKARRGMGLPDGSVAFEAEPGNRFWCASTEPGADEVRLHDGMREGSKPTTMARFVGWHIDRKAAEAAAERASASDFEPRIEADGPGPAATIVDHPVFGQGVVLRRFEDQVPKLEVDFGEAGCKLIAARFVRPVPTLADEAAQSRGPSKRGA